MPAASVPVRGSGKDYTAAAKPQKAGGKPEKKVWRPVAEGSQSKAQAASSTEILPKQRPAVKQPTGSSSQSEAQAASSSERADDRGSAQVRQRSRGIAEERPQTQKKPKGGMGGSDPSPRQSPRGSVSGLLGEGGRSSQGSSSDATVSGGRPWEQSRWHREAGTTRSTVDPVQYPPPSSVKPVKRPKVPPLGMGTTFGLAARTSRAGGPELDVDGQPDPDFTGGESGDTGQGSSVRGSSARSSNWGFSEGDGRESQSRAPPRSSSVRPWHSSGGGASSGSRSQPGYDRGSRRGDREPPDKKKSRR